MEWNGICYLGQRPSAGTSKVIQRKHKKERKNKENRTRRKHPTKLVEAAACCLLSPLTMTTGWILRGGGRLLKERENPEKIPGRKTSGRKRAFDAKGAEKIMENRM